MRFKTLITNSLNTSSRAVSQSTRDHRRYPCTMQVSDTAGSKVRVFGTIGCSFNSIATIRTGECTDSFIEAYVNTIEWLGHLLQ
mmetsp:Transcript_11315/g.11412  ORF Transcript_11315/g.11412 Transcript_11315/m.11412 type:complete len:84 (+) Transcript_11315:772-1023(+)